MPARFPDLRISLTEGGIDWVPVVVGRLQTMGVESLDGYWDLDGPTPVEVLFQSLDRSDGAETVAANKDCLGPFRCVSANPFIELARMDGALVGWQPGGAVIDDIKSLPLEISGTLLTEIDGKPRRVDQCKLCYAE